MENQENFKTPQVFFVGRILGIKNFNSINTAYIKFNIKSGEYWKLINGKTTG